MVSELNFREGDGVERGCEGGGSSGGERATLKRNFFLFSEAIKRE